MTNTTSFSWQREYVRWVFDQNQLKWLIPGAMFLKRLKKYAHITLYELSSQQLAIGHPQLFAKQLRRSINRSVPTILLIYARPPRQIFNFNLYAKIIAFMGCWLSSPDHQYSIKLVFIETEKCTKPFVWETSVLVLTSPSIMISLANFEK